MEVFHPDDDFEELVAVPDIPNLNEGKRSSIYNICIGKLVINHDNCFFFASGTYGLAWVINVVQRNSLPPA